MTMITKKLPMRLGRPLKKTAGETVQVHIVMPHELVGKIDVMPEKEWFEDIVKKLRMGSKGWGLFCQYF